MREGPEGGDAAIQPSHPCTVHIIIYIQLRLLVCIPPCAYFTQIFLYFHVISKFQIQDHGRG